MKSDVVISRLNLPGFQERGVQLDLLRLDLTHPQISGNKWFKLKYNLNRAKQKGSSVLLSFGGAWSNHIHALAFAGKEAGIATVGVIRGEEPQCYSQTLVDAQCWGMKLHFVSRQQYREKNDPVFLKQLAELYGDYQPIPEGGSNALAVQGCREIVAQIERLGGDYDKICCACGTGGTLAGLIAARPEHTEIIGVPVLKGADFLYSDIRSLLQQSGGVDPGQWRLIMDSHEGGYAKVSPQLADCMDRFARVAGIELEPVYTGKVMLALERMLARGELAAGSRVLMIHSGGMQGLRGMRDLLRKQLKRHNSGYNV